MNAQLLLFDLYTDGHHRSYLEWLARAWVTGPDRGLMEIAVPEELLEAHPDFGRWARAQDTARLALVPLSLDKPLRQGGLRAVLANDLTHGRVLARLIRERSPERVVCMFFDHVQASLALRRVPTGTSLSGVYFRPSFHYEGEPAPTRWRKRGLLRAARSHPDLHRVLTLDPFAVQAIDDPRFVWLPDGFDGARFGESAARVREQLGVPADHKMLLFFGAVSARKGIHEVLAALPLLKTPTTLVVAGKMAADERPAVHAALDGMPGVRHHDRYFRDEEVQDLFAAADVSLAAYPRHVGSSGILIRAAAAGTPSVGPTYGLMARQIAAHGLGVSVDPRDPAALADGIERGLAGEGFDSEAAAAYAASNSLEAFTDTFLREVLP